MQSIQRHLIHKPVLIKHKSKSFDYNTETEDIVKTLELSGVTIELKRGHRLRKVDSDKLTDKGVTILTKDNKTDDFNKTHIAIFEKLSKNSKIISWKLPGKFCVRVDEKFASNEDTPFWSEAGKRIQKSVLEVYSNFSVQIGCGVSVKLAYITQLLRNEGKAELCENHSDILYLSSTRKLPAYVKEIKNWDVKVKNLDTYLKFKNKIDIFYKKLHLGSNKKIFKFLLDEIKRIERIVDNQSFVIDHISMKTGEHTLEMDYGTFVRLFRKETTAFLRKNSIKLIKSMKLIVFCKAPPAPPAINEAEWQK